MKCYRIETRSSGFFEVLTGTDRSQAAAMTLAPGDTTGGPNNLHERSDQWLYVVEGSGSATVAGREVTLEAGDLVLIAARETHEIRASQHEALVTLNVYAPPEY